MDYQALWLTLRLALSTTAVLLLIALPVAWWIASGTGAARALVQAVVALPLVLPPTVLGFYLLVALGPLTAPGRLIIRLLGHPLAFSFSGLVVGSVLYSLPFAVQPLVAGFRAVDASLLEVAATLGASPLRAFRTIALPLAKHRSRAARLQDGIPRPLLAGHREFGCERAIRLAPRSVTAAGGRPHGTDATAGCGTEDRRLRVALRLWLPVRLSLGCLGAKGAAAAFLTARSGERAV